MRRTAGTLAAIVTLVATQGVAAAHRWSLAAAAVPPGSNPFTVLRGVSCTSPSSCTAVGGFFTSDNTQFRTLVERWDGSGWTIQSSPNASDSDELWAVSCLSETACVAVGQARDAPLAKVWDGSAWTVRSVPLPPDASSGQLFGVACAVAGDCTAVGEYDSAAGAHNPFAVHWDGTAWTLQDAAAPTGFSRFYGVSCSVASACTAVGTLGTTGGASLTLAERWDGTTWSPQSTPDPAGVNDSELQGASCPSATACVAVGYSTTSFATVGTVLAERWDGSAWSLQPTPKLARPAALRGVSCASAAACTAVGTDGAAIAAGWDGAAWRLQHTPDPTGASSAELTGVSCPTASDCFAVGFYDPGSFIEQPLIERYS